MIIRLYPLLRAKVHVYSPLKVTFSVVKMFHSVHVESPFDPEGRMTSYALYKLEREGVQLRSGISSKNRDFQALLRLKQPDANSALIKWLNSSNKSDIKPTWRNLLLVLRLVKLEMLAEQLESHLGWTLMMEPSKGILSTERDRGSESYFSLYIP